MSFGRSAAKGRYTGERASLTIDLGFFVRQRRLWRVFTELSFSAHAIRTPAAFPISRSSPPTGWPDPLPDGILDAVPELGIEIVSPFTCWIAMHPKIEEDPAAGAVHVSIADAQGRVSVSHAPTEDPRVGEDDTLRGEGIFEGVTLPLARRVRRGTSSSEGGSGHASVVQTPGRASRGRQRD
ncbi:MAG: hypothetical protein KatS3mg060_0309 [Dehalococcoidia bacterium]|nr:MAG: hypothetical protein KatS3mg060_0309 [Dehalococcoidia bacterium]